MPVCLCERLETNIPLMFLGSVALRSETARHHWCGTLLNQVAGTAKRFNGGIVGPLFLIGKYLSGAVRETTRSGERNCRPWYLAVIL